ncbi:MAG: NAD(P)/FAD-dependent oxidoreductase [Clostridia bacterium]|nr:NAD(P)/FAD-dependent oxidoreductase [Clostridia bacterium]
MIRENFKVYKAIIIGAGASGMVASIELGKAFKGENIALVEKLSRVGKKILSTGNGQCNLSNANISSENYHSLNGEFYSYAIENYGAKSLIKFFNELGVLTTVEEDKIYPLSKQASSVLDALRFKIESLNVATFLDSKVEKITKDDLFSVYLSNGQVLKGENVIVSVGGKSASHLGTDGSSYDLVTSFGHKITKLYPSLVQLKTDKAKIKGMKGLKLKANAKVVVDGKVIKERDGEVLFTDYGVSGNAIFYLSSYAVDKKCEISLDLAPSLSTEELIRFLNEKKNNCSYLNLENFLSGIINNKIASAVLRNSGFDLSNKVREVFVEKIVKTIKNYTLEVVGNTGFDNSQVTKGGIDVSKIDNVTLESKIVKGLYFAGEVMDVDGDCGGYNLQWAFSSAMAVSKSIK